MAEKKKSVRRGHKEGSVYYWEERKKWVAEVTVETGRRRKFCFDTKAEALKKKNEALRQVEQGTLAKGGQRKLGEYIEDWLENVHKDKLRVSTYIKYRKSVRYVTEDKIGAIWLQKLTAEDIQRFYKRLSSEKKLCSKTVNNTHGVLHLALENAVRWDLIGRNPCDYTTPPRIVTKEGIALTVEQAHILLDGAREHRLEPMLMLVVVSAMRRGEILALRWSDVDLEGQKLQVAHTVDYIHEHGYVETEPKTKAGKRTIHLPSFMGEMLQEHKIRQEQERLKQGDQWEDMNLVFPGPKGCYLHPSNFLRGFKKILSRVGLPDMDIHDLRHSAASILLAKGINIKIISQLLGHADITITLKVYSHLLPTMQEDIVNLWEEIMAKRWEDPGSSFRQRLKLSKQGGSDLATLLNQLRETRGKPELQEEEIIEELVREALQKLSLRER